MKSFFAVVALISLRNIVDGHSQLTEPQSTAPFTCRLGGEPAFGVQTCEGPCDMRAVDGGYANFASPDNPAATYARGQRVQMKYQRNNHGPGGFIRLTLVTPDKMIDKNEHDKNAFHYSCWGAKPVEAGPDELDNDSNGFGLIGSDGEQHNHASGYYVMDVTIPPVVPDGKYVLGWAWYGGGGGMSRGNFPQEPETGGYFGDYWSCSYVEIAGGEPLKGEYTPVFDNDMSQYSSEGCMSANDQLGVCAIEPCFVESFYRKPAPFSNGMTPLSLTPGHFQSGEL